MEKSRRFSTIGLTVAILAGLLSLPPLVFTWSVVHLWIRFLLRPADAFYTNSWMSTSVFVFALAGPLVILLVLVGAFASLRSSWPRWPVVALSIAIVIALYSMVVIPNLPLWDAERIEGIVHLATIEHSLESWGRTNGRFPVAQAELEIAIAKGSQQPSIYRQDDHALSYQLRLLPHQTGPYRTQPESPAIVYYAVTRSGNQFWLTASGLNSAVSKRAAMLKTDSFTASKQPWGNLLVLSDNLLLIQKR